MSLSHLVEAAKTEAVSRAQTVGLWGGAVGSEGDGGSDVSSSHLTLCQLAKIVGRHGLTPGGWLLERLRPLQPKIFGSASCAAK